MKPLNLSYPSVRARHGMVATSEPNAASVGLSILKDGGNAIDAAIAVAAALTVTEPTSNGIGGDMFALVHTEGKLYGLNASGPAPALLSLNRLKEDGITDIPRFGFVPVTVPGAVKGWAELHKRFGKLPFRDVLAPAIHLAKDGYMVSKTVSQSWKTSFEIYSKHLKDSMFVHWFDTFAKHGKIPSHGDIMTLPDHAKTLQTIADTYGKDVYQGSIAQEIDRFSKDHKGYLRYSDLASYQAEWVDPIKTSYKGYDVYEIPPNGQGAIALMALNIAEHLEIESKERNQAVHLQIEAMKLAFSDGLAHIADPNSMKVSLSDMLSKDYAKDRAKQIHEMALMPAPGLPISSGTVYLATADIEGNMVSLIQSNYMGFGSGLVVPGTGIALHNRGHNFSMDPTSPNRIAPLKKPYHTIIPGFLYKDSIPLGPLGVMGGFMQPQGHLQVLMNMIDFHMDPQTALDAPRWQWMKEKSVTVEPDFDPQTISFLASKGHDVKIDGNIGSFGRGQIILKDSSSDEYVGGTERRCDGTIASY